MRNKTSISRRKFLGALALATGSAALPTSIVMGNSRETLKKEKNKKGKKEQRYKISVCDWMILKRQKMGAFKRTSEIGADGLELDMGGLGNRPTFDNKILNPIDRKKMKDELDKYNLELSSIAMSGFYAQSFAEKENVPILVRDTINSMVMMDVKTAFLPLGVKGDLVQYPELRPKIVERLKMTAEMAEAAEVVIGIETALDAAGEVGLLREVGSPAIKSYFNFANALQNGRDLLKEIRILGKENICQIHCTDEDGVWLENNTRLNMPKVKATLDDIGWSGWLVIERSRDANNPRDVVGNFGANTRYLKSVFQ